MSCVQMYESKWNFSIFPQNHTTPESPIIQTRLQNNHACPLNFQKNIIAKLFITAMFLHSSDCSWVLLLHWIVRSNKLQSQSSPSTSSPWSPAARPPQQGPAKPSLASNQLLNWFWQHIFTDGFFGTWLPHPPLASAPAFSLAAPPHLQAPWLALEGEPPVFLGNIYKFAFETEPPLALSALIAPPTGSAWQQTSPSSKYKFVTAYEATLAENQILNCCYERERKPWQEQLSPQANLHVLLDPSSSYLCAYPPRKTINFPLNKTSMVLPCMACRHPPHLELWGESCWYCPGKQFEWWRWGGRAELQDLPAVGKEESWPWKTQAMIINLSHLLLSQHLDGPPQTQGATPI